MIIYKLGINEFPATCSDCPLCHIECLEVIDTNSVTGSCQVLEKYLDNNDLYCKRNKYCPLVEIKPEYETVFGKMRNMTNHEKELHRNMLNNISEDTGIDVWDGSGD